MIPREASCWFLLTTIFVCILVEEVKAQTGKIYDTNDWIPITPSSLQSSASETVEDKVASDRVLSLDVPAAQRFFPNEEYDYRNRRPNQVQQFLREAPTKKGLEPSRPRKLKHPSEYKFETPPPPPSKNQPQINYYNTESLAPYLFEQPYQPQPNYYAQVQKPAKQKPIADSYVAVPSVNPQAPAPDAPNLYEQYQLPFNASFYQSLNPSSINNDFYQAVTNDTQQQPPKTTVEQESVQLVYVPVENLKPKLQPPTTSSKVLYQPIIDAPKQHKIPLPAVTPSLQNQLPSSYKPLDQPRQEKLIYNPVPVQPQTPQYLYPRQEPLVYRPQQVTDNKQARLESIQQDFVQQALQAHKLQQQFRDDINPLHQEIIATTAKPKQKAHQPPLAVFLEAQKKAEISDVLNILRGAKTISVQDAVTPNSPQIFIGPSNLDSPEGYTKFPLPYLNNINGNRIERKIDQLPFFVAPVSYKTPPGYAKISLPSPHVGSVVVSVPTPTATPQPVLINQNQFGYSAPGYNPLIESLRPQEEIINNFNIIDPNRGRYQSTPAPQVTESPLIPPVRDIFQNTFPPRQPEVYYTEPNINQQQYRDDFPTLDIYRPQVQNQPTPPKPKEPAQLPDINPLELAINEFELHQINGEFEEHNKVKHSTTRRPQISHDDDSQRVSTTRAPQTRGRFTYDEAGTTERPASRGRTRGRARGSSARTTVTTTTTTTAAPSEVDRYTVLEEFNARQPSRSDATESYRAPSIETETEVPFRRTTTQFSANPYLPESNVRPQLYEETASQFELPKVETVEPAPTRKPSSRPTQQEPDSPLYTITENEPVNVRKPSRPLQQQESSQTIPPSPVKLYTNTEIEQIPANVYSLGQPQTYESGDFEVTRHIVTPTRFPYDNVGGSNDFRTEPVPTERPNIDVAPTHVHRFSPEVVSYENREPNQHRNHHQERPSYQPEQKQPVYHQADNYYDQVQDDKQETTKQPTQDPAGFLDNLYQPNFDDTYISLQDQAVRSLLVPNLLAPTKQESAASNAGLREEKVVASTEPIVEVPVSTEAETTTTTTARTRTRGRGRARLSTTASSTAPRKTASSRRRPLSRTSTERTVVASTDYASREDHSLNNNQNFRTRARPNEIFDRISTTENDIRSFKQSLPENSFEAVLTNEEPRRQYVQYEQITENQRPALNANPVAINQEPEVKEYQQVYSLPPTTTEEQIVLQYENTKTAAPVEVERKQPVEGGRYSNIKSGGVLINSKSEHTTKVTTTRPRGRTRGRSRFATTTSTSRPVTRPSSAPQRTTTQREEPEVYGFTRQPNYTPANLNIQAQNEPAIKFVGEIRPKYSARTTTPQTPEDLDAVETPRPRIRSRTRAPARKTTSNHRQSENEVHTARGSEQVTRRSGAVPRTRSRGSGYYRTPENVKRESDDEDVANQNYPANFLQQLDARPTTAAFKITVDPLDDQLTHSSIYRPKYVAKPNDYVEPNALTFDDKLLVSDDELIEETTSVNNTEEPKAFVDSTQMSQNEFTGSEIDEVIGDLEKIETAATEAVSTTLYTTQPVTTTTKKKSRRRGVWKLVKHRPVDPLEVSESQNYQSVINTFDSITKVEPHLKNENEKLHSFQQQIDEFKDATTETPNTEATVDDIVITTPSTTKTQENIFDTIYEMFGIFNKQKKEGDSSTEEVIATTTTTANPTFPEEITEVLPTTAFVANNETAETETTETVVPTTLETKPFTKPYEVEPWQMKEVKTSTSTEVSHETEICYKGRCVKSRDKKKLK